MEALVTVVILAILAVIALPMFGKGVRRAELKEVKNMVELTRAGAKYYNFKYGIDALDPGATQTALWAALKIDPPTVDAKCTYTINAGEKKMIVTSGGSPLYTFNLETYKGTINSGNTDSRYLTDVDNTGA